jgi:hypothetical protein
MNLIAVLAIGLASGGIFDAPTDVWTAPPHERIYPWTEAPSHAEASARLYLARGEWEAVQVCLRSDDAALQDVGIEAVELPEGWPEPEIFRVGYAAMGASSERAWTAAENSVPPLIVPDPLLPFARASVAAGETLVLWVRWRAPMDAAAGLHEAELRLGPREGPRFSVPITFEVFDLTLPESPTLRVLAPLNRENIALRQDLPPEAEAWKGVYESLAPLRISVSLWQGPGLVQQAPAAFEPAAPAVPTPDPIPGPESLEASAGDAAAPSLLDAPTEAPAEAHEVSEDMAGPAATLRAPDAARLKEHIASAMDIMSMNTINLGEAQSGILPFEEPLDAVAQDPLQLYLLDMGDWLAERGWLDRAVVLPASVGPRGLWQATRHEFFRVWRADRRVPRLMLSEPHPYFERYTDIWAMPLEAWRPMTAARLREGRSLASSPTVPVRRLAASSSGPLRPNSLHATAPEDANDGSLATAWASEAPPSRDKPQTLEIRFGRLVQTDRFSVGWVPGYEAKDVRVYTSYSGEIFGDASVDWNHHPPMGPYDASWSEAVFGMEKSFIAIRLVFADTVHGGPVAVRECQFGEPPEAASTEATAPVEPWLLPMPGKLPALAPDAHAVEPRLLAWTCWGHGFDGVALSALNDWPEAWCAPGGAAPLIWLGAGAFRDSLVYPLDSVLAPSIRTEAIRDGIEDYEYLAAAHAALEAGVVSQDQEGLVRRRWFMADAPPEKTVEYAEDVLKRRVAIGRALTAAHRRSDSDGR